MKTLNNPLAAITVAVFSLLFTESSLAHSSATPDGDAASAASVAKSNAFDGPADRLADTLDALETHNVVVTTTNGSADAIRLAKDNVRHMFGKHEPISVRIVKQDNWFTYYVTVECSRGWCSDSCGLGTTGNSSAIAGATSGACDLAAADPATILAVISAARTLFSDQIDLRALAKNMHYLAEGNIWPMWACQYADGTIVYNKFRWYRDGAAVANYFIGNPGSHDCDAFFYQGRSKVRWCTQEAASFAQRHGRIVNIYPTE
jgi:hypothetical protein